MEFFSPEKLNLYKGEIIAGIGFGALVALGAFFIWESNHKAEKIVSPLPANSVVPSINAATPSGKLKPSSFQFDSKFLYSLEYPMPKIKTTPTPTPEPITDSTTTTPAPVEATPAATQGNVVAEGLASYYSTGGCVGCSGGDIMANGQPLNDNALTLAENELPLGTSVKVENVATGAAVEAVVTDRGGFEALGRIADLTIATRDAIGCSSMCEVKISL